MSLRDIVAAECAEPNPLARLVNNFTDNKLHPIEQDVWVHGDQDEYHDEFRSNLRPEDYGVDDDDLEHEAEMRLRNLDRPGRFDIGEYERDLREGGLEREMPPHHTAADNVLSNVLKSFIAGAHSKDLMSRFEDFPDLGLSDRDKAKIRDRAGIMSRHFYANHSQDFADDQIDTLLHSLHIGGGGHREEEFRDMEDSWRNATRTTTATRTASEWESQYNNSSSSTSRDLHHLGVNSTSEIDDYDDMIRNTTENKLWLEENSHYASPDRWAAEYARGDGAQWAHEYSTKSDRQIEEDTMESAWNDAAHDRLMEAAWGEGQREVQRTGAGARNLTELTDAITKIDDPKLQASNFMKFMHQINKGQVTFADNRVVETDSMPPMMDNGTVNNDWLQEYDQEDDYYPDPREWAREYDGFTGSIAQERLAEYEFVVNNASNPYSTHENPFTAGVELFDKGMITESILALEAEVLRNPTNSAAWQYLGQAHAENDKDNQAIISLEKAVEVDPQNLDALAALAVSYTNDFSREKALDALETWLRRSEEYRHIPPPAGTVPRSPDGAPEFYSDAWARHGHVAEMFLQAAQLRPHDPDPEVQTALGLLYNLSYEYDNAVDCFKAALTKRPSDYRLWNKLGATLANSNRSEEALGAYFNALEGKPTYVRARANLGISFLALNSYQEAAQSFLSALRLHPNAAHLWDNLKMVFRLMGREDLEERASRNDVEAFGDEFAY